MRQGDRRIGALLRQSGVGSLFRRCLHLRGHDGGVDADGRGIERDVCVTCSEQAYKYLLL